MADTAPPHPATPYYQPPAGSPAAPKNLTVLAVLAFAAAAVATIFQVIGTSLVARAARTGGDRNGTYEDVDWSVLAQYFSSLLCAVAFIGAWVAASMWLYRARKNAEAIEPTYLHTRSAGWAWAGWVVPVVSLWFPFQVVRDVHSVSTRYRTSRLLGWWWGLFIAMEIVWRWVSRMTDEALSTGTNAGGAQSGNVFLTMLMVAALVLWGLVLRKITLAQHSLVYGWSR